MRGLIGVDIGGSGIKAGVVDSRRGVLIGERVRVPTPQPATPSAVVAAAAALVASLGPTQGPVGVGVPGPIVGGRVLMMANLDASWVGEPALELFTAAIGRPVTVLNDADAAARGRDALRRGTGRAGDGPGPDARHRDRLGAVRQRGPGAEPGARPHRDPGKDAERRASAGARERRGLSYEEWAPLLDEYLDAVDRLIWPDLIILGGGISKRSEKFLPLLTARARVVPAALRNEAGIVGAALRARALEAAGRAPRPRARRARRTPAGSAP